MASFSWKPERFVGYRDEGDTFIDTDAFPVAYVPEAEVLSLTAHTITWPDFRKGDAIGWNQWDSGNPSHDPRESAVSAITIGPQEWGPIAETGMTVNLDEVVLGTVPAKCDHLSVRVKLTRTSAPGQINGNTIPVSFKEGEWVEVDGGGLEFEQLSPIVRMVFFYLAATDNGDGTRNVIMRRRMSALDVIQPFYRTDNSSTNTGWTWGGTYGSKKGYLVAQRDTRGPSTDVTGIGSRFRRGGSNPPSTSDNTDYASEYTGDIEITAGYAGIGPTFSGADPTECYISYQGQYYSTDTNTATFDSWPTAELGVEDATRKIILLLKGTNNSTADRSFTSVKIGSTTFTQVVARQGDQGSLTSLVGIFIADVPTGTSGTLEVICNGSMRAMVAEVLASYNQASSSPDATLSQQTLNTDHDLPTHAGQGFAVAIGASLVQWPNVFPEADNSLSGIDNTAVFTDGYQRSFSRGFQQTSGETLHIANHQSSFAAGGFNGWIAASFH